MSDIEDRDEGQFVQRTVSASDCAPPATSAPNSVFSLGGSAAPPVAAAPEKKTAAPAADTEQSLARRRRAARERASSNGSPQLRLCQLLLQGDRTRKQIAAELPALTSAQISNALRNAKTLKRVVWRSAGQVFRLTDGGKAWLQAGSTEGGATPPTEGDVETTLRIVNRSSTAIEMDTSPRPQERRSRFRCAVTSDGFFLITKGDTEIELDPDEHAQMLHYLERMAEQPA